jgi:hypothetical protein
VSVAPTQPRKEISSDAAQSSQSPERKGEKRKQGQATRPEIFGEADVVRGDEHGCEDEDVGDQAREESRQDTRSAPDEQRTQGASEGEPESRSEKQAERVVERRRRRPDIGSRLGVPQECKREAETECSSNDARGPESGQIELSWTHLSPGL